MMDCRLSKLLMATRHMASEVEILMNNVWEASEVELWSWMLLKCEVKLGCWG